MEFSALYDEETKTIWINNPSKFAFEFKEPKKYEIEYKEYHSLFKDLGFSILKPLNNGEEFVYTYVATNFTQGSLHQIDDLRGYSFGDLLPYAREGMYEIFREVMKTKVKEHLKMYIFDNNQFLRYLEMKVVYYEGDILVSMDDLTETQLQNQELKIIRNTLIDAETAANFALFYYKNGEFTWSPSIYKLLEADPIEDAHENILLKYGSEKEYNRIKEEVLNLKPNQLLGNQNIAITTPKGKTKYFIFNAKKVYDKNGNFLQVSGYCSDITDETIASKQSELSNLIESKVLNNLKVGVYYTDYKGGTFFSEPFFEILGLEKDFGGKYFHDVLWAQIPDYMDYWDICNDYVYGDKNHLNFTFEYIHPITNETKYISLYNVHDTYDGKNISIGAIQDVTEKTVMDKQIELLEDTESYALAHFDFGTFSTDYTGNPIFNENLLNLLGLDEDFGGEHFHDEIWSNIPNYMEHWNECKNFIDGKLDHLDFVFDYIHPKTKELKHFYLYMSNVVRDGKSMGIGAIHDVTEETIVGKEKELLSLTEGAVLNNFKVGTFSTDFTNKPVFSDSLFEILGLEKNFGGRHFHQEVWSHIPNYMDYWDICKEYVDGKCNTLDFTFDFNNPKTNELMHLYFYMSNFEFDGKTIGIGAIQDVTDKVNYENDLIEADKEKTMLIKEVHHRVKNNLAIITSFISLEQRFHKNDPERIINITKSRISSLALIHEKIYNEDDLQTISTKEFFDDFDTRLDSLAIVDIHYINDIDEKIHLDLDHVTPLALIINELTTNSYKYAFNDENDLNEIYKSIKLDKETCTFHYKDNGPGLPEGFDIDSSKSLGWTIIKSLSSQLDGEYELFNDHGFNFKLTFPIK